MTQTYTPTKLLADTEAAKRWLVDLCEYDEESASHEAEALVGYWVDNYNPDNEVQQQGELRPLASNAPRTGLTLVGGRFYPHERKMDDAHDNDGNLLVWVDEAGQLWADGMAFC